MTSSASLQAPLYGNQIPSTSARSFFSERNGHVFDEKTGKEYKIQLEDSFGEIQELQNEEAAELTQKCLSVLQAVEHSSESMIQLQDLSISKGGVHIPIPG